MLCTSGFGNDVVSTYGATGPESDDACISFSSPGGGIGGEVCRLRLYFVEDVETFRNSLAGE